MVMLDSGYDAGGKNSATADALRELGIPNLRAMTANPTALGIHNKMLLLRVGGERIVHFGSWNGSETSALLNREMSVTAVSADLHEFLHAAFMSDWRGFRPTFLPMLMQHAQYAPRLLISEVMIDPYGLDMGGEWIEIHNGGTGAAILTGVRLGDALSESDFGPGAGQVQFPDGVILPAGGALVVAQDAVAFRSRYGRLPDFEIGGYDDAVPDMQMIRGNGASGPGIVNLSNSGDAIALSADLDTILDIVAWSVPETGEVRSFDKVVPTGFSLQRWPVNSDTNNCAVDFRLQGIPSPGRVP